MSIFTIYNLETKHIAEEKEFKDYIEAGKYCKENYSEGYVAKFEPFHFSSDVQKMLIDSSHSAIKKNKYNQICAVVVGENEIVHCGGITFGDAEMMKRTGIKYTWISKVEFINKVNSLASVLN